MLYLRWPVSIGRLCPLSLHIVILLSIIISPGCQILHHLQIVVSYNALLSIAALQLPLNNKRKRQRHDKWRWSTRHCDALWLTHQRRRSYRTRHCFQISCVLVLCKCTKKRGEAAFTLFSLPLWDEFPENLTLGQTARLNQGINHYCLLGLFLIFDFVFALLFYCLLKCNFKNSKALLSVEGKNTTSLTHLGFPPHAIVWNSFQSGIKMWTVYDTVAVP